MRVRASDPCFDKVEIDDRFECELYQAIAREEALNVSFRGYEIPKKSSALSAHNSGVNCITSNQGFRYLDHRTTRKGSVAMDFESLDGKTRATAFFGVSLKSSRGNSYPARKRGQFVPPKMGNFRKFWMQSVGVEPDRWCRVHKYMRSRLRDVVFTGTVTEEVDGKDQRYFKMRDLEPI